MSNILQKSNKKSGCKICEKGKKVQKIKGKVRQAYGQARKRMEIPPDLCIKVADGN